MLVYFALTLFVSAALLFLVQPMVGKMILPSLGGTPAVWNTCMVFFQAVLLVGYAYTHTVSTWRSRRNQLAAQAVILLLPFVVLPFTLGEWRPPEEHNPVFAVLWLLLGMVGLPFFVVATSAPLLQKWFASTGHPAGKDPYFLYGASNLGSMLALLLYPLAVEPFFALEEQTWLWTIGYAVLAVLVLGCMVVVWRARPQPSYVDAALPSSESKLAAETATAIQTARRAGRHREVFRALTRPEQESPYTRPVTWLRRLRWIGLAAAPSSLMLGVTTHLTTDIAAIPLLWILPLALYLLTFILVFARWPVVWTGWPHSVVLVVQLVVIGLLLMDYLIRPTFEHHVWVEFLLHILVFFFTTLMCHGELAKDRPSPAHLTEFYLCMSLGGVLGGMFNALVAPLVFRYGAFEYPLAMMFACLLRPRLLNPFKLVVSDEEDLASAWSSIVLDVAIPIVVAAWTYALLHASLPGGKYGRWFGWSAAIVLVGVFTMFARPVRFVLALAAFFIVVSAADYHPDTLIFQDRGFFGFVRVRTDLGDDNHEYKALIHGGINHGWQAVDPAHRRDAITYFHPTSGIGQLFQKLSWPDARLPASLVGLGASPWDPFGWMLAEHSEPPYAVVGLGIGTLASHAKPWQHVRFYEIDPIIKRLSLPPDNEEPIFTYLSDALDRGSRLDVVMGDGRLSLKGAPDSYYHILVLDAFSSDAIPVHLLTKEAVELYLTKLAEGGVLIFNTTNRFVDIRGVLKDLADDLDLDCWYYGDYGDDPALPTKFSTDWVVLQRKHLGSRHKAYNGGPPMRARVLTEPAEGKIHWTHPEGLGGPVWTDRYSNLLSVLRW